MCPLVEWLSSEGSLCALARIPENLFLARLRGMFGRRSRALAACILLLVSGSPIRPEEIEEHMRNMSKAKIVQAIEHQKQHSGDPPGKKDIEC